MPPIVQKARVAYIDWMRGLACLLMFQTHCYDSWLSPAARQSRFFMYSQLGGTFPAPLFLFLAGMSFALVTEKLRQKNLRPAQIARNTIRRGAEILGFGLLFRLQEFVVSWGWAPKSDLLRVDILNTIGVSMILMGVLCWLVLALSPTSEPKRDMGGQPSSPEPSGAEGAVQPGAARPEMTNASRSPLPLVLAAAGTALFICLLTPLLWTTWSPDWLPWPLESYINGLHNLGSPQPWLFPIFPWSAFAFAGLAVGFVLQSQWTRFREARIFLWIGLAGSLLIELSRWLDARPYQLYPVYDYWHTSPNFFLTRLGMLMVILTASYAWCRWGAGQWGFSPVIQLGQASLLVYWVHIEFVYGRLSILPKHTESIAGATAGLLVISLAMLALAYVRTHIKEWRNTPRTEIPFKANRLSS
jgi:uncharacterized membrane protein